jgi:2-isopropylmalate synthase
VIPVLQLKLGGRSLSSSKLKELTAVSHYVAEICNMALPNHQPFTGRAAFAHKGGVHINAMMKNSRTYEHLDPRLIGNHRRYLVSELGGKTNIQIKAKELRLRLEKESPETRKILSEIQKLEHEGYQFEAAEASFELLVHRLVGKRKNFFDVRTVSVRAENIGSSAAKAVAEVRLVAKGAEYFEVADGDGPVNALDKALRKALRSSYPVIDQIHLTDYKVRVVNSDAGTAAKVRVFIQFRDKDREWTTVGVHENIVEASWHALVEAIEYKLLKG